MHIKNLTNSPYSLLTKDGEKVMLAARGEIDIDPHPMYVSQYRQAGYFVITESAPTASEVEAENPDPSDSLRTEHEELSGEDADKPWSKSRRRSKVAEMGAPQ